MARDFRTKTGTHAWDQESGANLRRLLLTPFVLVGSIYREETNLQPTGSPIARLLIGVCEPCGGSISSGLALLHRMVFDYVSPSSFSLPSKPG